MKRWMIVALGALALPLPAFPCSLCGGLLQQTPTIRQEAAGANTRLILYGTLESKGERHEPEDHPGAARRPVPRRAQAGRDPALSPGHRPEEPALFPHLLRRLREQAGCIPWRSDQVGRGSRLRQEGAETRSEGPRGTPRLLHRLPRTPGQGGRRGRLPRVRQGHRRGNRQGVAPAAGEETARLAKATPRRRQSGSASTRSCSAPAAGTRTARVLEAMLASAAPGPSRPTTAPCPVTSPCARARAGTRSRPSWSTRRLRCRCRSP